MTSKRAITLFIVGLERFIIKKPKSTWMARNITRLHSGISGSNSPCYAPWLSLGSRSERLNLGEPPGPRRIQCAERP